MRLQRSPKRGMCLVASFAMALNMPAEELLEEIGDGWQTLAFPDLPVPYCWRGVHIQELIVIALSHGIAVTPIQLGPQVDPPMMVNPTSRRRYSSVQVLRGESEEDNWRVYSQIVMACSGVITGTLTPSLSKVIQRGHAVAFERGVIFDPDSEAYMFSMRACEQHNFYGNCAWRFDKINEVL